MRAVLDTSVLVDALHGEPRAVAYLEALPLHDGLYSVVSLAELLTGAGGREREQALDLFLRHFQLCDVDRNIALQAGRLREVAGGLKLPDALIAATAIVRGAVLVSRDRDHVAVEGLKVVVPGA